jgi:hypothetical protein
VSVAARLLAFAAALVALFGVGAAAGRLVDPSSPAPRPEASASHGEGMGGAMAMPVRGLAVAENGLRLVVNRTALRRDRAERLTFRIVRRDGRPVRRFDLEHTKRMHLILARRDLTHFRHLHPAMRPDGTWTTTVRLPAAGTYRLLADFSVADRATTLGADLRVSGPVALRPLPAPAAAARATGGYEVALPHATDRAGRETTLPFRITRGGRPVAVQPYLGAAGHLVALREGDLAFLHVHPTGHARGVAFETTFPSPGRYRLFLQFKHEGRVHTVAFTREVS